MKKILFVNACVRPESRTNILARHLLGKQEGETEELVLEQEEIQPLNLERMQARDKSSRTKDFSGEMFRYARQFAEADTVVIAAPYWDLSFPAMLKNYFEAVTVQGLIFYYTDEGIPKGLTNVKEVIYVTTAGGPIGNLNLGFDYVNALCHGLYGIEDVTCYKAEMLDIVGADVEGILKKTMDEIDETYR